MRNNRVHMMMLKIFDPRSISVTPCHLLGSIRFPLFGTGITWPSFHSAKSTSLSQNEFRNANSVLKFPSVSALNAYGGTSFNPGDFPFANFAIAFLNSYHKMLESSSHNVVRCSISRRTFQSMGRWCVYTFSKWGPMMEVSNQIIWIHQIVIIIQEIQTFLVLMFKLKLHLIHSLLCKKKLIQSQVLLSIMK